MLDDKSPSALTPANGVDGHVGPLVLDEHGRHPLVAEIERLRAQLADVQRAADNLEIALVSGRQIGAAVGVIMAIYHVTYEQGFDMLREVSQHTHRKLRHVAADVLFTGALPDEET